MLTLKMLKLLCWRESGSRHKVAWILPETTFFGRMKIEIVQFQFNLLQCDVRKILWKNFAKDRFAQKRGFGLAHGGFAAALPSRAAASVASFYHNSISRTQH